MSGGRSAKNKGSGYERELAKHLTEKLGIAVQRTPLSGGGMTARFGPQLPDLMGTHSIWLEAKRTERFAPLEAMAQAERGIASRAGCNDMPVVVNRRNGQKTGDSTVVMKLDDWLTLYRAYLLNEGILRET